MHRLIWLIPLLPLAGAAVNGLLGRRFRFSERLVAAVAVGSVALAFLIGVAAVYSYGFSGHALYPAPYVTSQDGAFGFTWIPGGAVMLTQGNGERAHVEGMKLTLEAARRKAQAEGIPPGGGVFVAGVDAPVRTGLGSVLDVEWSYQLDALSSVFILIVTGVGLCIFVFATGYMHGDAGFYRFFAYLGLFMFSMLVLVMGSNFLMMFVGWEGVGLCSYLLIGYYFDRKEAGDAARKAFITNRIGDFGFALAVFGVIATFGSAQYTTVFAQASAFPLERLWEFGLLSWIALGLFVGACGKSAQIPLYVWLPDAMAGPTPVSALIHAATMVTAGLYMLTRTNVIFQHSQTMMLVVAIVGAATALFAATIGITQNDIKKVLAYSTVSQLGFMFLACGVGAFVIGIFHVMTHAFFKALMFLGAGSVIHGMHHEQDMRRMGGLKKYMPKTYLTFLAGWLAICGIIPFSGFWSKDEILWRTVSTTVIPGGWLLWIAATVAATCTAFYMTRLVAMTFWGKERFLDARAGGEADEAHAHGYDEFGKPHDARTFSAGDRPHHEPGEHVGAAHDEDDAQAAWAARLNAGLAGEEMPAPGINVHKDAAAHDAHAHGEHHGAHVPHESPASMWVPLAALAVLAVLGGLVGISPAFTGGSHVGGRLNIVNWLDPVIWNPATGQFGTHAAGGDHARASAQGEGAAALPASDLIASTSTQAAGEVAALQAEHARPEAGAAHETGEAGHGAGAAHASPYGDTGFNLAHALEGSLGERGTEWLFIVISLVVAGFGIFLGWLFYIKNPRLPDIWAARLGGLYRASFNKYWVDELYGKLVTRRTMDLSRGVYKVDSEVVDGAVNGAATLTKRLSSATGAFDSRVVDGVVNGVAYFIRGVMSNLFRAAQTGFAANYALVMVLGLAVAVAVFVFWR
ncbi:MAG TPA: NADH-quinone oxidoreductase subunit L [Pyrinomonadaceae bacterium]|jgi:NADH-quinone oxidoreductase subunit L|nr:NADH-quinone oxidoreductase subunit L [Pyrinomonadaceae bacterium]